MKAKAPPPFVIGAVRAVDRALEHAQRRMAPAPVVLLQLVSDRWRPQALAVVARLGIADLLAAGPLSAGALAQATGSDEDALRRVLRALARDRVFAEPSPGTFANNWLSEPLRSDHPQSIRHTVIQTMGRWNNSTWSRLDEAVATGDSQFQAVFGKDLWGYFEDHPEDGSHFHRSMRELTRMSAPLIAAAYDFGRFGRICDLGGGAGELIAALLAAHPALRGAIFDSEAATAEAHETLRAAGVEARAEVVHGNFFERVPAGYDAYLMKHIVHGFSDDAIAPVLEQVRLAMGPKGKLVVLEMLVPAEDDGTHPSFLDLQMLVGSTRGRERSRDEFERLFAKSGMRLAQVIRTVAPVTLFVVEAA